MKMAYSHRYSGNRGVVLTLCLAVLVVGQVAFGQSVRLQRRLDKLLKHKDVYPWKVSVLAEEAKGGRRIFASRETRGLIPASNMKLVVTAAGLSRWGAEHEFETVLGRKGKDLVVIGSGDPGFAEAAMQIKYGQDPTSVFRDWAKRIKAAGVGEVGDIIVDDSIFDGEFVHPDWPKKQLHRTYTPMVGGLNLWGNLVWVRRNSRSADGELELLVEPSVSYRAKAKRVSKKYRQIRISGGAGAGKSRAGGVHIYSGVADPGVFFGSVFRSVLGQEGVSVKGQVVRKRLSDADGELDGRVEVLARNGTKLRDIIGRANKLSSALFAECLIKALGSSRGPGGSWDSGSSAVGRFLTDKVGADREQFVIADGSGLSRKNRLSPTVLVGVLKYMAGRGDAEVFRESLAVWGQSGTLRRRSKKSALAGRLLAKTGTINGVRSLSGYIRSKRGKWIAVSILMNNKKNINGGRARQLQQDICELLVSY